MDNELQHLGSWASPGPELNPGNRILVDRSF